MIHRYFVYGMLMVRVGPDSLQSAYARKMGFLLLSSGKKPSIREWKRLQKMMDYRLESPCAGPS